MRRVEIFCLDSYISDLVCIKLEEELKKTEPTLKYVSNHDSMLSHALQLLQTYTAIPIDIQTRCYLDAAREHQSYIENIVPIKSQTSTLLTNNCYLLSLYYLLTVTTQVKIMIIKYLIKKVAKKPSLLYFLKVDVDKLIEQRKSYDQFHKGEINFRGNARRKQKIYLRAAEKMCSDYGIPHVIIEESEDIDFIVKKILEDMSNEKSNEVRALGDQTIEKDAQDESGFSDTKQEPGEVS